MLLAAHAKAIFLVPSTHEGTRWEIERLLGARELVRRTIFFVPPDELVLGGDVGPHLQIGASPGPVGSATIREEAIKALQQLGKEIPVSRIEKDIWGALFRLRPNGRVTNYRPLESRDGLALSSYTVGPSTQISMAHFRCTVEELLRLVG